MFCVGVFFFFFFFFFNASTCIEDVLKKNLTLCFSFMLSSLGIEVTIPFLGKPQGGSLPVYWYLSCSRENWSSGFPTRSDTYRPVQSQKKARSLKFWMELLVEDLYYPFNENKGADQHSWSVSLFFSRQKLGFLMMWLISVICPTTSLQMA